MSRQKSYADQQWEEMQREPFAKSAFDGMGMQVAVIIIVYSLRVAFWVGLCVVMYMIGKAVVG